MGVEGRENVDEEKKDDDAKGRGIKAKGDGGRGSGGKGDGRRGGVKVREGVGVVAKVMGRAVMATEEHVHNELKIGDVIKICHACVYSLDSSVHFPHILLSCSFQLTIWHLDKASFFCFCFPPPLLSTLSAS